MDISVFNDSDFKSPDVMNDFLLVNEMSHSLIAMTLENRGLAVDSFLIGSYEDENNWLEMHNLVHEREMTALGIKQPVNLRDVDMKDEKQWYDWLLQHSLIHQYTNQALGLK